MPQSLPLNAKGCLVSLVASTDHMHLLHVAFTCACSCPQCKGAYILSHLCRAIWGPDHWQLLAIIRQTLGNLAYQHGALSFHRFRSYRTDSRPRLGSGFQIGGGNH
jgi:hypothetical protein